MRDDFYEAKPCHFCHARPRVGSRMMTAGTDQERPFVLYCYGENHTAEAWGETPDDCVKNWNAS